MIRLVDPSWVEARLGSPDVLVLDPRGRMKYLQGHLRGAINLPIARLRDADGRLRSPDELAGLLGSAGLDRSIMPLIYDSYDGQRGAVMAWVLEYLGRSDVQLMDTFFEGWAPQGREVFYRPVEPSRRRFIARVAPDIRATLEDVKNRGAARLLDVRSVEEFVGEWEADERPGHIPGAVNVPWDELVGTGHRYLESMEGIERRLAAVGISAGDSVIAYCAVGVRASVAYLALRQLGLQVRLYDGSFAEWTGAALPVEIGPGT